MLLSKPHVCCFGRLERIRQTKDAPLVQRSLKRRVSAFVHSRLDYWRIRISGSVTDYRCIASQLCCEVNYKLRAHQRWSKFTGHTDRPPYHVKILPHDTIVAQWCALCRVHVRTELIPCWLLPVLQEQDFTR